MYISVLRMRSFSFLALIDLDVLSRSLDLFSEMEAEVAMGSWTMTLLRSSVAIGIGSTLLQR